MPHENKYKHLREVNPITELWRMRREQRKLVGNAQRRMKMCSGKRAYDSKENAEKCRDVIDNNQKVYKCPVCKLYHAASRKRKRL